MYKELKESLNTHKAVIWGLLNREIITKFGDSYFGYAWLIIEPMLTILTFYLLFYYLGRNVGDMPILLFLLTGVVPFFYFRKILSSNTNAINSNQALLAYRQVKVIDTVISRIVLETTLSFTSAIICTLIIIYTGQKATLYYPLQVVFAMTALILFSTGISLVLAIVSYYYIDLNKFIGIINRILFFTSGVFFSLNDFSPSIAYYLSFNPVLQIIELIRSSFSLQNKSIFLSNEYILVSTIISLFFGFICYYVARRSIMMNARAR